MKKLSIIISAIILFCVAWAPPYYDKMAAVYEMTGMELFFDPPSHYDNYPQDASKDSGYWRNHN